MDTNHLPLSDELVKAVLLNSKSTFDDMYAIYKSLCNSSKYGMNHDLTKKTEKIIRHYVKNIEGRR